uniref:Uncharacterized protein n=1 Tax=Kalanchoe fedtschenkoi TaxID=63787 RepID=A0A7N0THW1_KALFE
MREEKKTKQQEQEPQQGATAMLNSSSSLSSRRRQPAPETHSSTSVGCMSGIFHLFSKHHSTRRKFLTFGKKEDRRSSTKTENQQQIDMSTDAAIESTRSPTLPQEIQRRSSSVAAEKRMLLLGALAKCDADLRELKKIIDELKSDSLAVQRDDGAEVEATPPMAKEWVTELSSGEQPSPVSVLDELARSPPFSRCASARRRSLQYGTIQQQKIIQKRREEEFLGSLHLKSIRSAVTQHGSSSISSSPSWCSRAMVETVEKACSEIAWGENRERGRIGMALQDQIYRDLMEETVKEFIQIGKTYCSRTRKISYSNGRLPRHGCRRRLSY